jgi:DNA-binding NtrC family response regulator
MNLFWLRKDKKSPLSGKKILIIDPEEIIGPIIISSLQGTGINFKSSGLLQLTKSLNHPHHLIIISEIFLYKVQSFRLQHNIADTPIIIAGTGLWPEEPIKQAFQLIISGALEFISPPFTKQNLAPIFEKYINHRISANPG